jgi:hypothetical protein
MFQQIRMVIDDPISIEAFYSEMRMCNDPKTGQHAEDYNQMVNQMVLDSKPVKGSQLDIINKHPSTVPIGGPITSSIEQLRKELYPS